jgi:oligopeptide transport system substrate-binding protein
MLKFKLEKNVFIKLTLYILSQFRGKIMKNRKKLTLLLSVAMVVSFTGCQNNFLSNLKPIDSNQFATIAVGFDNISTLDPSKASDKPSKYILQECEEALTREEVKDGKDEYVPAGAESFETSSDGKTWTIHLRNNTWSDGKAVTADQYVYALKRTLDKTTASEDAYLLVEAGIKGAANYNSNSAGTNSLGVQAVNNLTLKITLERPCPYFTKLLATHLFIPEREDLVKKYGDNYGNSIDTTVYDGPFKVTYLKNSDKVEMVKNESYWDKNDVKLSKITMLLLSNEDSRMNALVNNKVDLVDVANKIWDSKIKKLNEFNKNVYNQPQTYFIAFNFNNKYLGNAKIRQAISEAINRDKFASDELNYFAKPAYGIVPPAVSCNDVPYTNITGKTLKNGMNGAKSLFNEGLKEVNKNLKPEDVTIEYLVPGTSSEDKEAGDFIKNELKTNLGININCDYLDSDAYLNKIANGNYGMCFSSWTSDYNDPLSSFDIWTSGSNVINNNWYNSNFDNSLLQIKNNGNESNRLEKLQALENSFLIDNAVVAPLYFSQSEVIYKKYLDNIMIPNFSNGIELKYAYTSGRNE